MKVLLDENFPMGLMRCLHDEGVTAEHIITIGWRGATDVRIRQRLDDDQTLFMTQDDDFLFGDAVAALVVVSRVRQSRLLSERIEIWRKAIRDLLGAPRTERLFELTDAGALLPWEDVPRSKGRGRGRSVDSDSAE